MKRISPGTVTVGVLAIVCGLIAAYVIKQMNQKPVAQPKVAPKGQTVVVARVNIEKNTRIRLRDLETITVPHDHKVPEGLLTKPQVAADRIVVVALQAGQALHKNNLLDIGERMPGLADRIPAGMRALTINVEKSGLRSSELDEKSKVDIAMTVEGDHPDLGEAATRTLLRSVAVLEANGGRGNDAVALTVAVTSKDANKLINAQKAGTLNVTLVSKKDQTPTSHGDDDSITRRDLLGLSEIPEPAKPRTIQKWEGGTLRIIELGKRNEQPASEVVRTPATNTNPIRSTSFENSTPRVQPKVSGPQL